jgi:hypothetical protein
MQKFASCMPGRSTRAPAERSMTAHAIYVLFALRGLHGGQVKPPFHASHAPA